MARKVLLGLLALILGLGSGFFIAQQQADDVPAAAAEQDVATFASRPLPIATSGTPEEVHTEPERKPVPALTPSPAFAPQQYLQRLAAKTRQLYRDTWVHVLERRFFDVDVSNNGVLPNGAVIPLNQINEFWYRIDARGEVTTLLTIMKTTEGEIVQTGICRQGRSWNSISKEMGECVLGPLQLDGGFQRQMQWLLAQGGVVSYAGVTRLNETQRVYKIHLTTSWAQPWYGDAYKQGIVQASEEATFDAETGVLVEWKTIFRLVDGSQRIYRRIIWQVSTATKLPAEVEKLLEQK